MTSQQIRRQYIDFFVQKHGHSFVPSSPVVPHDDPTLLFTNAGMNQFKPYFLGTEKAPWKRVANTQKCIRAGGKHNDLDDVGRSRRHHTFFEMLGNWSFGDYFKRGAIEMAWELLTKVWKLDPTRLHVTCFEGDEKNGVPRDAEAANLWKEIAGMPDDHIHYFGADNFWEMGDTGPCGPCSEIYVDRTPGKTGGKDVNGDDPRVMEIWNLVFIQYNRNPDRSLTVLPAQHVDTGMGFERVTQVLQDKNDNFGIDLFDPFWEALTKLCGKTYGGKYPATNKPDPAAEAKDEQLRTDIAFRVIADHIRCLTFAMTDGAVPSNEGRGYVLRRILRRAVRFGRQQLGLRDPFFNTLVPVVVDAMGEAFPELKKNPKHVEEIIRDEEVSFGKTLDRGIALFEEAAIEAISSRIAKDTFGEVAKVLDVIDNRGLGEANLRHNKLSKFQADIIVGERREEIAFDDDFPALVKACKTPPQISSDEAFKLHDTYGFPIDLTRIMAEERGMSVDIAGYERLMEEAKVKARVAGKAEDSPLTNLPPDAIAKLQAEKIPPTNDEYKFSHAPITATIKAIWDGNKFVDQLRDRCAIILNHTNFYAEMGGQVGDKGELLGTGANFVVADTKNVAGYVLHIGFCVAGPIHVGMEVEARVGEFRTQTEKNHTATHLANWALREVLGEGVQQKGSLVDPEKLRFDFSHGKAVGDEELARVETLVNEGIAKKMSVYAEVAPQEQALKIHGLRAVFGEKYPPMVRVVSIGAAVGELLKEPSNAKWRAHSIEFCGGTHLKNTGEIEAFAITGEESVSKGIRRITALTGTAASAAVASARELGALVEKARTIPESSIPESIAAIQKQLATPGLPLREKRKAQSAVSELQAKQKAWEKTQAKQGSATGVDAIALAGDLLTAAPTLGPGKLIVGEIPGVSDDQLRSAMDSLRKKAPSHGILLGSSADAKVTFVASVSPDLIAKGLKAGDWIRETAKIAGGGGGGRPEMAQAGGKDPSKLGEALARAREIAQGAIK